MHTILEEQEKEFEKITRRKVAITPNSPSYTHIVDFNLDDIRSFLRLSNLAVAEAVLRMVEAEVNRMIEEDDMHSCKELIQEKGTDKEYDCSDIHIGKREALSDITTTLTEIRKQLK